jgi:hypothetical protein
VGDFDLSKLGVAGAARFGTVAWMELAGTPGRGEEASAPSICFVVPYMGSWPPWFPAYLQSCRYNPSIRWIFFTDCETPAGAPDNVEFVRGSLRNFGKLFKRKTGIRASVETPYKLCEYKPAYGLVFEDYLAGFDFWGHCDVDVIWGDIRGRLATDEILAGYDVVSPYKKRITGACALYRNTDEINRLARDDDLFRWVAAQSEFMRYDEHRWAQVLKKKAAKDHLPVYWPRFLHPKSLIDSSELFWESGALFDCTGERWWRRKDGATPDGGPHEVLYVHFITWKRTGMPCDFGYEDDPSKFLIAKSGIRRSPHRRNDPLAAR